MRVLVTSTPGLGHVLPVHRTAAALRAGGHELHWVVGADNADAVAGDGVEVTVAGMPVQERLAEFGRRYPEASTLPEHERRALAFSKLFGELAAPEIVEVVSSLVAEWCPDLVLHDAAELAGPLAAAAVGIPSVCQGFGEIMPELSIRRAGQEMAPHWRAAGLEPDPYAGSYRGLYLDIYPPGLRGEDMAHVPLAQRVRPADGVVARGGLVYVTFGTVFNVVDDGFRAAVLAAADVADEVLVTVGQRADPAQVGPVPANVTVERFVAQSEVLPRSVTVVCHGGSGTLLASLAHGLPLVCLPRGADQFANAANLARAGAGADLRGPAATDRDALRDAVRTVLEEPGPRAAAASLAAEIAAMPSAADAAATIESFAEGSPA